MAKRSSLARIAAPVAGLLIGSCSAVLAGNLVRVAPAAPGEPLSSRFTVSVDNRNVPVYTAHVLCISKVGSSSGPEERLDGEAGFASFDMGSRGVTVKVVCSQPVQSSKILPSSYGIVPIVSGNTVSLHVAKPGQITLEVNGDWNNSLHLFANPLEADAPNPNDPNVIYFGPGIHKVETVHVGSGQTVYIADGAIVYGIPSAANNGGPVFSLNGSNIVLRGRGIIDGSLIPKGNPGGNIIVARGSDIKVEGIVMRDSGSWNFPIQQSQRVSVKNIKIFGFRGNSDGVDINNSSNVEVSDCFFRTFDDNVVIKSSTLSGPETRDVTVTKCVHWNEIAHPLSLGAELNANCENIVFSDCDIIHDKGREWCLRVYNAGSADVKHVVFENIRIEEARHLFSVWIGKTIWVKKGDRGHVEDVVFRNITSAASESHIRPAELIGFDPDHAIHGVGFDHAIVGGRAIGPGDINQNPFADGVTVNP